MSRGALLQLVAKNEIDDYMIDTNIKSSIFQNVIKKTTNFSEIPYSFYASNSSTWGSTIKFTIKRIGDLLTNMYLVIELPVLSVASIKQTGGLPIATDLDPNTSTLRVKWNDYIGNTIIENVILRIGGQKIDEMSGEYMQFYTELYNFTWSKLCMLGHTPNLVYPQTYIDTDFVYIPLHFFFCNDLTKALPIIALEYHEIEVEIKLKEWEYAYLVLSQVNNHENAGTDQVSKMNFSHTNYKIDPINFTSIRLDCNFIFLDRDERVAMVNKRHEILITQTQTLINSCRLNDSIYLTFTNPIKELIFALQRNDYYLLGEISNYSGKPKFVPMDLNGNIVTTITDRLWNQIPDRHLLQTMSIEFNGIERIPSRDYKFWHHVQNFEHYRSKIDHNIYMYSFGLTNKENTGSCNFSMLDSVRLNVNLSTSETFNYLTGSINPLNRITVGPGSDNIIKVYANNYNIFVIESGMGGVMYTI